MRWYLSAAATREWQRITGLPSFEHAEANLADFVETARLKKEEGTMQQWVAKWKPSPDEATRKIEMRVSTAKRPEGPLPQLVSVRDRGKPSGGKPSPGQIPGFPRWLIDDTAAIADACIFVFHTRWPRFLCELIPNDELTAEDLRLSIAAPHEQSLARIQWIDNAKGADLAEIAKAFQRAYHHHESVRE
ncbi:MAG: hypothetical protein ACO1RA_02355 [Planctomycetaceae bacterium]